jgi:saccharopine dehydrogenase-like NADP-dependent oxidoreductase
LDVNAGSHGKYFATNFDPEINFREFKKVWAWIDRKWVSFVNVHTDKWMYKFPVVGERPVYLNGHDELHSLYKNIDANSIRFWMGFGDHYLNVFNVLKNIGMLSEVPVKTAEGVEVVPLKVLKAVLPDPASLAPGYTGHTCIGNLVKGEKGGKTQRIVYLQHLRPRGLLQRGRVPGHFLHGRCAARRRGDFGGQGRLEPQNHGQRGRTQPGSVHRAFGQNGASHQNRRSDP